MSVTIPCLAPFLEPSWGPRGLSSEPFGLSLSAPGESWSPLVSLCGCVGAILAAFWAVVERRQAEKAGTPKTFENYRKINVFCSLVPSWGPPGESLVGLRGRLGGFLGRLGAVLGVLERPLGVSGPSQSVFGVSWRFLVAFCKPLGRSWVPFGQSWGALVPSWSPLGILFGCLGAGLGASVAVLERRVAEKAGAPKTFLKLLKNQ